MADQDAFHESWQRAERTAQTLLEAYRAERALADQLAEALRDRAIAAHQTGSVRDHWLHPETGKVVEGGVQFELCSDPDCADAWALLAAYEGARRG